MALDHIASKSVVAMLFGRKNTSTSMSRPDILTISSALAVSCRTSALICVPERTLTSSAVLNLASALVKMEHQVASPLVGSSHMSMSLVNRSSPWASIASPPIKRTLLSWQICFTNCWAFESIGRMSPFSLAYRASAPNFLAVNQTTVRNYCILLQGERLFCSCEAPRTTPVQARIRNACLNPFSRKEELAIWG